MTQRILVALQTFGEFSDESKRLLKNAGITVVYNTLGHRLDREEIVRLGQGCVAIIAGVEPYDRDVLDQLPDLRCISRSGVGTDAIDVAYAKAKGIVVLNTPQVVVQPVSEMALAMMFDLLRHLSYHTGILKTGKWEKRAGHLFTGRKIGIIGLGRIGKRVGELCRALQATVMGYDVYPDKEWAARQGVFLVDLETLITTCDIISVHISVTSDNPFVLGAREFNKMKKGTILINTSRGQVIDEVALYEALRSGHLGGAGLDVFQTEPYDGPITSLDNIVLTPHISTLTEESRSEMEREATVNALRFLKLPFRE